MSFRRQVHVLLKPNITPPGHISFSYLGTNYRVFLSTESVRCFSCGEYGHISRVCKRQGTDDVDSNETNPLNLPLSITHQIVKNLIPNTNPKSLNQPLGMQIVLGIRVSGPLRALRVRGSCWGRLCRG